MIRATPLLAALVAAWLAVTVALVSCGGKQDRGDPRRQTCRALHERNRTCVKALVATLHARMGQKVPADIQRKMARQLGIAITQNDFRTHCEERVGHRGRAGDESHRALAACRAMKDCSTYAACFLAAIEKPRPRK